MLYVVAELSGGNPCIILVMIKMPWITKEEMIATITQMGFVR